MSNLQPLNAANRREASRRSALDDYLCLVDLGDNRSAMLLDVSETGIGVQSVEGVGEGFSTDFRFQLPDTAVLVEGVGEIAWVDRAGRMGIRFTKLADEVKPELRNWVLSEANPLFAHQPETEQIADLDARDRVAQLEARIIVSGWAQLQALNFLVDQIAAMTQASGVAIALEDGSGIICKASSGIAPQVGVKITPRSGLSWECVRTKEVVTCVDTENDPRVDRLVCRELNMRSAMLVPVMKDNRVAGLVEVFSSRPHAFSNQTVILLKRVAEAVASLDETAPEVAEDSLLQMPVREPERRPIAPPPPVVAEKTSVTPAPAPVIAKPAPQPAPVASSMPKAPAPVAPATAPTPTPATASTPAAAVTAPSPAAQPTVAPVVAPAATKLGIPFAQEVAVTSKPVQAAPVVSKQVDPPLAVVSTPGSGAAAAPKLADVASVSVNPAEQPENVAVAAKPAPVAIPPAPVKVPEPPAVKPVVQKIERPVPPPARERAVVLEKVVPEPAVVRPAPVMKSVEVPPAPAARVPSQSAPLPAVAFSGAEAAATKMFEVPAAPVSRAPAVPAFNQDEQRSELPIEGAPDIILYGPELDEKPDHRKIYIGAAAVVMIALSSLGGWYLAHQSTSRSSSPAEQSSTPPTANAQPSTVQPLNPLTVSTSTAASVMPPTTSPVPTPAKSPASKQPVTSTAAAPKNETGNSPSQPAPQPGANSVPPERITATTFAPRSAGEPSPQPPSIPIAPPNTAGMATLLAAPVAAPTLGRTNVSQGVTGGKQIARVQPVYPSTARALHLSGLVSLTAHVAKDGSVSNVKVLKGHPLLNAAAVEAVKRWKYQPFLLNGQPIENDVNVQVRFDLPR